MAKGSVRKKGATWSYRIDLGVVDGKRKQKEKSGFKTEKEAEKELSAVLNQLNTTGIVVLNKNITMENLFKDFIEIEAKYTRSYSTIVRYKSLFNTHVKPKFGDRFIYTINFTEIQQFLNCMIDEKKLSREYTRSMYNFLMVLFKFACKCKCILGNTMEDVTAPKQDRYGTEIKVYTDEELSKMEERFKTTYQLTAFKIAINTGVRAGECYALCWSDIDFNNSSIKINKQLQYHNKMWCFTPVKTINSNRTIRIGEPLKQYLLAVKSEQEQHRYTKVNRVFDTLTKQIIIVDDFINIKPNGEMLCTNSDKTLSRICKNELKISFKFHNLRHTHTTKLVQAGVNPKYVQARLGHSKLETTLKYYTHITEEQHNQVLGILNKIK